MASTCGATGPFRHTWKSLPDSCANFRCFTENWNDSSKRKTYLECDAQDLNGTWKKSRLYLDENVKANRDGMDYRPTHSYSWDTLSSNLVSPHPKVTMRNGKLDLTAHGQGPNGPIWRTVTLHDLMNEDGVVFSSDGGLGPKELAIRQAGIDADKAKKEAEKIKRDAARKALEPLFREEWLDLQNKEIKALEEMRRLSHEFEDPFIDDRIKAIQNEIATTVPSMPESWSSKKLQQISENEEKAKKEAERKDMELTWKKWKQYVLTRDVERSKESVKLFEDDPRNLDIMKRNLRVSEANLAKFPMMTMPEGWRPDEEAKSDIERMELEPIWRKHMQDYFTFNIGQYKKILNLFEGVGDGDNAKKNAQRELEDLEEQFAKLPEMRMPDGWRPAGKSEP